MFLAFALGEIILLSQLWSFKILNVQWRRSSVNCDCTICTLGYSWVKMWFLNYQAPLFILQAKKFNWKWNTGKSKICTVKGILYRILEAIWNSITVTLNEENKADKCWHFASIKVDFSKRLDNKLKLSFFFLHSGQKRNVLFRLLES